MKKHYKSSSLIINEKDSTTEFSGTIDNIIKNDKTGIEKSYIKENFNYKEEVAKKILDKSRQNREKNQYQKMGIKDRKREEQRKNKEYKNENIKYNNKNTYKEQERKATMYDGEIDLDRVKSYRNSEYENPSYKSYKKNTIKTPEEIYMTNKYNENSEDEDLIKHDTEYVSRGMESLFIKNKISNKDMIYYENRNIENSKSKIINKNPFNIIRKKQTNKENQEGRNEGRNKTNINREDSIPKEGLTNRTLQNNYIRSRFAENMENGDEEFSINISKTGIIVGEKNLKLGASLGRYTSIGAINIFRKEKIENKNLKSTLINTSKDAILNFEGGNSKDLGIGMIVNIKNKTIAGKRLVTDRKGFMKTSINNFDLESNNDLGIKSIIQMKNTSMMSTRVLKGIYGTSKTTIKTGKRVYGVGRRAAEKVAYGIRSFGKSISNPMILKGILTIAIPLLLILLMVAVITSIFPSSTAVASYPIAEVEFIEELQDNINTWNEEVNNEIQGYYETYDDVIILNEDFIIIYLQDVLSILAVETNQNMGFDDLGRAREIHESFYSLETREETYKVEESTRYRIIVDLQTIGIEDVSDNLNFDENSKEWLMDLATSDLSEMYPDLVVNNEMYYPSVSSMTPEEIAKYGGKFIHPTDNIGYISSPFGYRMHPIHETIKLHAGIDIAGNDKKPIYAVNDGIIIHAGTKGGYGNCVMIDHGDGMITLYGHCSTLSVSKGESVSKGDNIARVGNSGLSTGAHLHFEVRINGKVINPINFLD